MKNESKPQKTSISVTKRVFSVVVCIALMFAINLTSQAYDTNDVIPIFSFKSDGNIVYGTVLQGSDIEFFYADVAGSCYFVACSKTQQTIRMLTSRYNEETGAVLGTLYNGYYYNNGETNLGEFCWATAQINPLVDVYTGSTWVEAVQKGIDAINSPEPEPEPSSQPLNISLPAGNVLIADISNTGSNPYYLETTSGTTGAVVKPGMNNIQIGFSNTVPSTFTVPNSSWDYPSWNGTGSASVLGTYNRQSTQGDFALSNTNAQKYVIITNPMYPNDNNAEANRLNSDLNITIDKVNSYVIYSLQTGYVSGNLIGTNDGSQYIDYEYDEDTGEWVGTNQDGEPASPVWGGQNDFENTPTTINDWLENIAHQISSFFSGAIGAITTLSVAVKNFAGTLMSLYLWLPSPVLSILSSAVMLAIVIGVIKVFI